MNAEVFAKASDKGSIEAFDADPLQGRRVTIHPRNIAWQEGHLCSQMLQQPDFLKRRVTPGVKIDEWKLVIDEEHVKGGTTIFLPIKIFALFAVITKDVFPLLAKFGPVYLLKCLCTTRN